MSRAVIAAALLAVAGAGAGWYLMPEDGLVRAAAVALSSRMNRCTLRPLDARGLAEVRQWEESHDDKPLRGPYMDWAGQQNCLAAAVRVWKAVLVALLLVLAAAAGIVLHALQRRAPSILRPFWWPALGAGLFFSLAATWIEWHLSLGMEASHQKADYYSAYNGHLALAALFTAIFTGLLAAAIKRLWHAVRAEQPS